MRYESLVGSVIQAKDKKGLSETARNSNFHFDLMQSFFLEKSEEINYFEKGSSDVTLGGLK